MIQAVEICKRFGGQEVLRDVTCDFQQGKTNLIEAVNYVATLGSHRVATDAPLVRVGAELGFIRCGIRSDERDVLVEIAIIPGKANRARVNRGPVPKVRDVLGLS